MTAWPHPDPFVSWCSVVVGYLCSCFSFSALSLCLLLCFCMFIWVCAISIFNLYPDGLYFSFMWSALSLHCLPYYCYNIAKQNSGYFSVDSLHFWDISTRRHSVPVIKWRGTRVTPPSLSSKGEKKVFPHATRPFLSLHPSLFLIGTVTNKMLCKFFLYSRGHDSCRYLLYIFSRLEPSAISTEKIK